VYKRLVLCGVPNGSTQRCILPFSGTMDQPSILSMWLAPEHFSKEVTTATRSHGAHDLLLSSLISQPPQTLYIYRLAEGADLFVRATAADLRARNVPVRNGKPKYLIALPVIGTGSGGARHSVGKVLRALLKSLIVVAREVDVDVALVTIEEDVYAAAQLERRRLEATGLLRFPLSRHLTAHAERLAKMASSGHLVIFMGAGISAGAGLPLWNKLLDDLAEEVGLGPSIVRSRDSVKAQLRTPHSDDDVPSDEAAAAAACSDDEDAFESSPTLRHSEHTPADSGDFEASPFPAGGHPDRSSSIDSSSAGSAGQQFSPLLQRRMGQLALEAAQRQRQEFTWMNPMDKARLVQQRLAQHGRSLGELVCSRLQLQFHALSHAHLAAMPVKEVVTTNYDTGYEQACQAIGKKVDVLPHSPGKRGSNGRWILKMHGCVTQPDSIVLTRQDYVRYNERFAALGGILMSALLTRHIVFLGFSLSDDNFARLFDAVQKARPPKEHTMDAYTAMALASQRTLPAVLPAPAASAAGMAPLVGPVLGRDHSSTSTRTAHDTLSTGSSSVASSELPQLPPAVPGSLNALLQNAVGDLPSAYHYAIRHSPLLAKVLKLHLQNEVASKADVSPRTRDATRHALRRPVPGLQRSASVQEEASSVNNEKMGTVLAFTVNTLQRELWGDDLAFAYIHNRDFNFLQLERARLRASASALPSRPTAKASGEPATAPQGGGRARGDTTSSVDREGGDPTPAVEEGHGDSQGSWGDAGVPPSPTTPPAAAAGGGLAEDDEEAALDEELFEGADPSIAEMARVHDVFLDYLAFLCTSATPHLMVHRFDSMLSHPERQLKKALDDFVVKLATESPEAMAAPEWAEVERMLLGLGGAATLAHARVMQRSQQREPPRSK